jgi:uncharacterized protein with ParB-like and HNH nuclease domain
MIKTEIVNYTIYGIYSLIESGKIVVPNFQRRFVWSKSRVKKFLESIYKGYPIGIIIVLEEEASRIKLISPQESLFPIVIDKMYEHNYLWFVLDGSQRLAALYNSFFADETKLNFSFDLEKEEFILTSKASKSEKYVTLHSLYSPDEFLKFQKRISESHDYELYYNRLLMLHNAFNEYQFPIQVISNASLNDAISIFEAVNTVGQRLTKSDLEKIWKAEK